MGNSGFAYAFLPPIQPDAANATDLSIYSNQTEYNGTLYDPSSVDNSTLLSGLTGPPIYVPLENGSVCCPLCM